LLFVRDAYERPDPQIWCQWRNPHADHAASIEAGRNQIADVRELRVGRFVLWMSPGRRLELQINVSDRCTSPRKGIHRHAHRSIVSSIDVIDPKHQAKPLVDGNIEEFDGARD